ncbi:MAG: TPM domain-containing protein [Steroidobacteraceae bacterium]
MLSESEIDALDRQVGRVHATTGVRVVAAEIGKADTYEELPWKAFALGVSLAALTVVGADTVGPYWHTPHSTLLSVIIPLAAGAVAALLTIFVPAFGRLFLHAARCEVEVGQYAQALFLRRELFKTPKRNAILILVSRFERRVHILPDTGLHGTIGDAECHTVIERMRPALREARIADALQAGLVALEDLLVRTGYTGGSGAENAPPDPLIEEKGA